MTSRGPAAAIKTIFFSVDLIVVIPCMLKFHCDAIIMLFSLKFHMYYCCNLLGFGNVSQFLFRWNNTAVKFMFTLSRTHKLCLYAMTKVFPRTDFVIPDPLLGVSAVWSSGREKACVISWCNYSVTSPSVVALRSKLWGPEPLANPSPRPLSTGKDRLQHQGLSLMSLQTGEPP